MTLDVEGKLGDQVVTCGLIIEQRTHHQITGEPMKFLTMAGWTAPGSNHDILCCRNGMAPFSIRFLGLRENFGRLFLPLTHPATTPILSMST
jgi:hypothetical protein